MSAPTYAAVVRTGPHTDDELDKLESTVSSQPYNVVLRLVNEVKLLRSVVDGQAFKLGAEVALQTRMLALAESRVEQAIGLLSEAMDELGFLTCDVHDHIADRSHLATNYMHDMLIKIRSQLQLRGAIPVVDGRDEAKR